MFETFSQLGLLGLFLASFLAATVIPASSELVLLFLIYSGFPLWTCIIVATAGNTLGGITTYFIGYLGNLNKIKTWSGVSDQKIEKYKIFIHKYGYYCALLSWLPFVGDVLLIILGLFRTNRTITLLFMFIGKLVRYIVWAYMANLILT